MCSLCFSKYSAAGYLLRLSHLKPGFWSPVGLSSIIDLGWNNKNAFPGMKKHIINYWLIRFKVQIRYEFVKTWKTNFWTKRKYLQIIRHPQMWIYYDNSFYKSDNFSFDFVLCLLQKMGKWFFTQSAELNILLLRAEEAI